jgi:predicted nucleotidyltransferase component of viral defense system
MTKKNILTALENQTLDYLFSNEWFKRHFYLTGGTALAAFYLYHRYSEDLDFFCHDVSLDSIPSLMEDFKKQGHDVEQIKKSPSFYRYLVDKTLKVDFVADVGFRVGIPECVGPFMVDSLKNIAVNKLCAILGRLESKDYVDLYFILQQKKYDIMELMVLAQNKDAGLEPFIWSSIIADVQKLAILPRMIKPVEMRDIKTFFLQLRDFILDQINPDKKQ